MKADLGAGRAHRHVLLQAGVRPLAWWHIKALVHDLLEAVKLMADDDGLSSARPRNLRSVLFTHSARLTHHARTWTVRAWEELPRAHLLVAIRRAIVELAL